MIRGILLQGARIYWTVSLSSLYLLDCQSVKSVSTGLSVCLVCIYWSVSLSSLYLLVCQSVKSVGYWSVSLSSLYAYCLSVCQS